MAHSEINNKHIGLNSEYFFMDRLNELKTEYEYIDKWYDFEINNHKIELKSCRLTIKGRYCKNIKRTKYDKYQIGRFDLGADKERIKRLIDENVWFCLLVRHEKQFIILGLFQANQLKYKRYISIHQSRDLDLIGLEAWLKKYGNNNIKS